ncbi:MAG: tetratricopeptide repeat protein, partial [bacterium]|nr:tetratricopeptide repeat protein [bacterium]
TGAFAALLMAFTAGHIQQSHYYTVDPALTFWSTLGLYLILQMPSKNTGLYLALGLVIGLATGTRLVGIWLGLPFLMAHLWPGSGKNAWQTPTILRVALTLLVAAAVTLACEPFLLIDPGHYTDTKDIRGFLPSMQIARGERIRIWALFDFSTPPYLYYLTHQFRYALGTALEIAALLGIGLVFFKRNKPAWLLLSWIFAYFLFVGGLHTKPIRYATPLLPVLVVLGAWACLTSVRLLKRYVSSPFVYTLPIVLVLLPTLVRGTAMVSIYGREDSRIQAARWIQNHVPENSEVLGEHGGFPTAWMVPEDRYRFEDTDASYFIASKDWMLLRSQINFLKKKLVAADWIVLIEENRMRQYLAVPDQYPIAHTLFQRLSTGDLGYDLVAQFKSPPEFWSWQIDETQTEPTVTAFDHPRVLIYRKNANQITESQLDQWIARIETSENLPDRYILEGVTAFQQNHWQDARQAFQKALKVRPEFALAYILIGEIDRVHGDQAATQQAWEKATEIRGSITRHTFLGMVEAGLKAEGVVYLEGIAQMEPDDPILPRLVASIHFELALEHQQQGRFQAAIALYQKVIERVPDNLSSHLNIAACFKTIGQVENAIMSYQKVLKLDPQNKAATDSLKMLQK